MKTLSEGDPYTGKLGARTDAQEITVCPPSHRMSPYLAHFNGNGVIPNLFLSGFRRKGWTPYLVGGALRRFLIRSTWGAMGSDKEEIPNDVDIVIDAVPSNTSLHDFLKQYFADLHINGFGGVKCRCPNGLTQLDFWSISDDFNVRSARATRNIRGFIKSTLLDVNTMALDLDSGLLHEADAFRAVKDGIIGFNRQPLSSEPHYLSNLGHVLEVLAETRFEAAPEVADSLRTAWQEGNLPGILRIVSRRKPGAMQQVEAILDGLFLRLKR